VTQDIERRLWPFLTLVGHGETLPTLE
jgi:hypothetical protein